MKNMKTLIEANNVGEMLKMLRIASGLQAQDVAKKAFISKNTLSNAENGKVEPSLYTVENILEVYGKRLVVVDVDDKEI